MSVGCARHDAKIMGLTALRDVDFIQGCGFLSLERAGSTHMHKGMKTTQLHGQDLCLRLHQLKRRGTYLAGP